MKLNPTPHKTAPAAPGIPTDRAAGWQPEFRGIEWLAGLVLVLGIVLAYQPAGHAGFIWDDDDYIIKDKLLTAPDGLWRIWFSLDSPSQYFPLTYTAFRFEHMFWGLRPAGYHWVNIVLHAVNALLVWGLLRRLAVPGAWLAAAVWGLHPVQVETVAWVTELKNVLMGFFFLLTLRSWIRFVETESRQKWIYYSLALILYALALTAKTTACTLPAALLLILWWKRIRIDRRKLFMVVPFVILGVGMGLVTVWWERYHVGTRGPLFSMGVLDRILVATRAVWFYAGKLVWPVNLTFSYPRWNLSASAPLNYLWLAALGVLGAGICRIRRYTGRGVEVAVLFFVATLSPTLGFIMLYTFLYSFVADHYQYVACLGLIALACGSASVAANRIPGKAFLLKPALGLALITLLGTLTWRQCGMYANRETLWRATIARNPASWMAHLNLGSELLEQGRVDDAVSEYQRSLRIKPDHAPTQYGLGLALAKEGKLNEAIADYEEALRLDPRYADAHNNLGNTLFQMGQVDAAIGHYEQALRFNPKKEETHNNLAIALIQKGRFAEAITEFEAALQINPHNAETENNLAWALVTVPVKGLRDGNAAVKLAREANRLTDEKNPGYLRTLAAAYAEDGQFPEAVETAQRAWQVAEMQCNPGLAVALQSDRKRYQAGQPLLPR